MGICQHVELASAGAMWAVIKVTKFVVVWGVAILLDRGVQQIQQILDQGKHCHLQD